MFVGHAPGVSGYPSLCFIPDSFCLGFFELGDELDAGGELAEDSLCLGLFRLGDEANAEGATKRRLDD